VLEQLRQREGAAAIGAGLATPASLRAAVPVEREFDPGVRAAEVEGLRSRWRTALARALL
jgi:hypothetical protein